MQEKIAQKYYLHALKKHVFKLGGEIGTSCRGDIVQQLETEASL